MAKGITTHADIMREAMAELREWEKRRHMRSKSISATGGFVSVRMDLNPRLSQALHDKARALGHKTGRTVTLAEVVGKLNDFFDQHDACRGTASD